MVQVFVIALNLYVFGFQYIFLGLCNYGVLLALYNKDRLLSCVNMLNQLVIMQEAQITESSHPHTPESYVLVSLISIWIFVRTCYEKVNNQVNRLITYIKFFESYLNLVGIYAKFNYLISVTLVKIRKIINKIPYIGEVLINIIDIILDQVNNITYVAPSEIDNSENAINLSKYFGKFITPDDLASWNKEIYTEITKELNSNSQVGGIVPMSMTTEEKKELARLFQDPDKAKEFEKLGSMMSMAFSDMFVEAMKVPTPVLPRMLLT